MERAARRLDPELFGKISVGMHAHVEDAAFLAVGRGTDDRRASAVAEEHGHVAAASREIEAVRVNLAADDQDALVLAGANERIGHVQAVEKARTLVADVHRRNAGNAELRLEEAARARKLMI